MGAVSPAPETAAVAVSPSPVSADFPEHFILHQHASGGLELTHQSVVYIFWNRSVSVLVLTILVQCGEFLAPYLCGLAQSTVPAPLAPGPLHPHPPSNACPPSMLVIHQ